MSYNSRYISTDILWCATIILISCFLLKNNFISNVGTAEDGSFVYSAIKIIKSNYDLGLNIKSMSPLYQCWQILLINLFGTGDIYFFNHILLIVLTSIVCFYFFKAVFNTRIALFMTILINSSYGLYNEDLLTYRFAFIIVIYSLYKYHEATKLEEYIYSLLLLYLSTFARSEYIILFVVIFFYSIYRILINDKSKLNLSSLCNKNWYLMRPLFLISFIIFISVNANQEMGNTGSTENLRLWKSFSQFYTTNIIEMGLDSYPDRDPSIINQDVMSRDFPGADNLFMCIIISPSKFIRHVLYNIKKCTQR